MSGICFIGLGGYSVFMSVDHFHKPGETVRSNCFFSEPGGKGYNQAVAAARLGAKTAFVGAFGNDDTAKMCLDFLNIENVISIPIYKTTSSAYACIITDSNGDNKVTVYSGAASELIDYDIYKLEPALKNFDMFVLQNEVNMSANVAAMSIAQKYGIPVIINPAPSTNINTDLLNKAFLITPNQHEAETIFGKEWEEGMRNAGIRRAIVTLGKNGSAIYENDCVKQIPAVNANAVDTTGAGDCFTAALAVKLISGETLLNSAKFATKAAAIAVSRRFAVKAMPKLCEIR